MGMSLILSCRQAYFEWIFLHGRTFGSGRSAWCFTGVYFLRKKRGFQFSSSSFRISGIKELYLPYDRLIADYLESDGLSDGK